MKPTARDIRRTHFGTGLTFQELVDRLRGRGFDVADRSGLADALAWLIAGRYVRPVRCQSQGVSYTQFVRNGGGR